MPKRVQYLGDRPDAYGSAEGLSQEYSLEPGAELEVPDEDLSKLSRFLGSKLKLMRAVAAEANTGETRTAAAAPAPAKEAETQGKD
jgi:hypothetical protein